MEAREKNSCWLGFPAMDWQGPAARRAGIVLIVLVCIGLGIAIAGTPSSPGNPKLIVVQAQPASSSTTTTEPETTSSGPSTTAGSATTTARGTTTTSRRPTPTAAARQTSPTTG